jgi:RNA-binding protein 23/39
MSLSLLASWSLFNCRKKRWVGAEAMVLSSKHTFIHPSIHPSDWKNTDASRFRDPNQAREALEKMNGFDLAGRPIRVGLGNDKFTPESTANLLQRFQGQGPNQHSFQGSSFSGAGGRGAHAGGSGGNFDRAGGRDNDKGTGGASALDDTDVAGVNFNNYSRDALMRKLARTDEPADSVNQKQQMVKPKAETKPLPVSVSQASRCVLLRNMFNPAESVSQPRCVFANC